MRWQVEPSWDVLDGMVRLSQIAVERSPSKIENWRALILAQIEAGRAAEVAATLLRAAAALGSDLAARKSFIKLLLAAGELERAVDAAEALFAEVPQDQETFSLLKSALVEAGGKERLDALQVGRDEVLQLSRFALNDGWESATSDTELRALVQQCRTLLAANPGNAAARCFLAHGLARLGEAAEAEALAVTTRLLSVGDLRLPEAFASDIGVPSQTQGDTQRPAGDAYRPAARTGADDPASSDRTGRR